MGSLTGTVAELDCRDGTTTHLWLTPGPLEPPPSCLAACLPPCRPQDTETLTLIQGWFMNCVMVSRSVGSVFSRRRISCLARDEGRGEAAELLRASLPATAQRPQALHVPPNS